MASFKKMFRKDNVKPIHEAISDYIGADGTHVINEYFGMFRQWEPVFTWQNEHDMNTPACVRYATGQGKNVYSLNGIDMKSDWKPHNIRKFDVRLVGVPVNDWNKVLHKGK